MNQQSCDLRTCFMCAHCSQEWRALIAIKKNTHSIKKGSTIFIEGQHVQGIFFLYEGSVKIHMQWGEQKELILRFAKKGDILGYRGLGKKHEYPVTATALENTKVCFISNEFLEATLQLIFLLCIPSCTSTRMNCKKLKSACATLYIWTCREEYHSHCWK